MKKGLGGASVEPQGQSEKKEEGQDAWESVTTQPFCEICDTAFSSVEKYNHHLSVSLYHMKKLESLALEKILSEEKAKEEAAREAESAREAIATERKAAVAELKSEVAKLSVSIAEQLIRAELADAGKQEALVSKLMDESPLK